MNDENDHDQGTEHIEKWGKKGGGGIFGASSTDSDSGADDASSTHNSTNGTANPKSGGKKIFSGWKKQGDGQVDEPEYEGGGGKPKKEQRGFFQGIKDNRDYKDYQTLANDYRYGAYSGAHKKDEIDEATGDPSWRAHYEELKDRKKERDAFAEEYRKHTGRDFNERGPYDDATDWYGYSWGYGPNGSWRGENGEIDWDDVNRKIAQGYLTNYAQGVMSEDHEGWTSPDWHAASYGGHYTDEDVENELREKFGVTDEQIQEAYRQVRETGRVDPALFRDSDTSQEEAEQAAEVIEQQANDAEGGAVFPGGTGEGEDGGKGGKGGPTGEENPDILSERNGSVMGDGAKGRQQTEWKPSVTSQRMMDAGVAGLNMFGNVLGGANKAFSMLRGLASALTSRQLMSDPTLPARGFLNAMDQSGQIIEDHIRQVGEAYGIKDGVKREDLVGTYKGAQYYREKQRVEDAEKQYYAGVGNALSTVLGNNVNVNDPVSIQNALAQMGPDQLSQLDDALFGQNGTLRDMYDATVTNPTGSTKEQNARAQLFTTLNQALKGQAQANAREAGRARTQTNQQIQQYNQESRRIKAGQEKDIANANQLLSNPQAMAAMPDDEQMATFVNAILGRKINNKQIPLNQNGEVDIGTLKTTDLNALMNVLQQPEYQNLSGAMALKQEVNDRLEAIRQNAAQTAAQNRSNALAPIANSPLDMDISVDRKNLQRDRFNIPYDRGARGKLRDKAKDMIGRIRSTTNSQDDIALCENVITMCDLADAKEDLSKYAGNLAGKGVISNIDRDIAIQNAEKVYELMANSLATTVAERTARVNAGQDWAETAATRAINMRMKGTENFIRMKHKQFLDNKQAAKDKAAQDKADAEKAKADAKVAAYEKAANRDGRGISLAPYTPGSNRYRNDDLKNANTELAQIEKELATISPTDKAMNGRWNELMNKKVRTQSKIRQIHQENHIQKLIYDAGELPRGEANDVRQKAEALRGQYSDWKEFGKAINAIRREAGLRPSTAWSASARAEREQQAHSENKAMIEAMNKLTNALNGQPDAMKNVINDFLSDKDGKFEGKVLDILNKSYGDLTDQLLGDNSKLPGLVEKAMRNAFDNHIRDEAGKMIETSVTNAMEPTRRLVEGVRDVSRSIRNEVQSAKFNETLGNLQTSVSDIQSTLSKALMDTAENKIVNVADIRRDTDALIKANTETIEKLVNAISTAGSGKPEFSLSQEDLKKLEQFKDALVEQNGKINSLMDKMDQGGVVTRQDILNILDTLNDSDRVQDKGLEDTDWDDMEMLGDMKERYSVDDLNEIMDNYAYLINMSAKFSRGLEEQDQQGAIPVRLTDDAMETLANMISRKIIEAGGPQAWAAQNTATDEMQPQDKEGAAFRSENDREPASETPIEAQEGPVEEQSVSEEEQVGPEVEGPSEAILTPGERQELEEAETYESNPYELDNQGKVDFALDDWLNRLPHLKEYTRQHPEALRYLSMEGDDGKTVHQTLKDAIFRSFDQGLFEGQSASNIMAMMDEFLSQTSRGGFEQAVKEWKDLTDGQRMDPERTRLQKGVIENVAGMAETALGDVFREDFIRRRGQPPADADIRTNGYAATDDLRRTMRVVASAMAEEAELRRKGLGEDQIKARMEQEDKAQKKASEQKAESIVKDLDPQIGNILAMNLRDKLFYSSRAPAWSDYRSILDSLGELREKYPGVMKDIDATRDGIVFGMIVPQLMGFKNIANVSPSDTMTKDKIEEISRRAMEIGLAKRQAVTDKNLANGGEIDKLSDEDRHWLGFPTVDELVNSHVYGRDNDKDPVDIHRAKVRRQERGNMYNNRLAEAYRMAAREITLNDKVASELEKIRQNSPYTGFMGQIGQVGQSAKNLTPAQSLWDLYNKKDGSLTIQDVNTALGSYRSAIANASKLKEDIGKHLDNNKIPVKVSNEYGEMDIPQDVIQQMNSARDTHRANSGMGDLDQFFGEGDISKQVLSLEALKEKMYEDGIMAKNGFDEATAKKVIEYARKAAKDSNKFEDHIDAAVKKVKKEIKAAEKQAKAGESANVKTPVVTEATETGTPTGGIVGRTLNDDDISW